MAKNKATVPFVQPNPAGKTTKMPAATGGNVGSGAKIKSAKPVAPKAGAKFKSIDSLMSYRKKKYGA